MESRPRRESNDFLLLSPWQKAQEEQLSELRASATAAKGSDGERPALLSVVMRALHGKELVGEATHHQLRQLHREIDELEASFGDLYQQMEGMVEDRERSLATKVSTTRLLEKELQRMHTEQVEEDQKAEDDLRRITEEGEKVTVALQHDYEALRRSFMDMSDINEDRHEMQNLIVRMQNGWANDQYTHETRLTDLNETLRRKQLLWANRMPEVLERHKKMLQLKVPRKIQERLERATRLYETKVEKLSITTAEIRDLIETLRELKGKRKTLCTELQSVQEMHASMASEAERLRQVVRTRWEDLDTELILSAAKDGVLPNKTLLKKVMAPKNLGRPRSAAKDLERSKEAH